MRRRPETAGKSERYARRLESILKASSEVFAERGFDGASVRAIAARAEISLSGIYYYFESKEKLLFALQRHTFTSLIGSLKRRLQDTRLPEERLLAVIQNHIEYFFENMASLEVCSHELHRLTGGEYERILEYRREYYELARKVISELMDAPSESVALSTLHLFGSLNWIYMWYDSSEHTDIRQITDTLANIYLNGLNTRRLKHN